MRYAEFASHVEARQQQLVDAQARCIGAATVHFAELGLGFGVVGYEGADERYLVFDGFSTNTLVDDKDLAIVLDAPFFIPGPRSIDPEEYTPVLLKGDAAWTSDYFYAPPLHPRLGDTIIHLGLTPGKCLAQDLEYGLNPLGDYALYAAAKSPPGRHRRTS